MGMLAYVYARAGRRAQADSAARAAEASPGASPYGLAGIYMILGNRDRVFALLERGALRLELSLSSHWPRARALMARYDRMDLADAAIVVMSELHANCRVLTVDRKDFSVYRRHDRRTIDFMAP